MPKHRHSLNQENLPCLLTDYDDDVAVRRETFHEFMARQAEEHWANEITSLDIEGPAIRIAAVIEKEVGKLTKKLDAITTAMAVETSGDQASRLFAMIPSRENLIATLDDLVFSKLQPVEGSAQRPLAIGDASSSASGAPKGTPMMKWQDGNDSVTGVPLTSSQEVDSLDFYPLVQSWAPVAKVSSNPNTMPSWKSSPPRHDFPSQSHSIDQSRSGSDGHPSDYTVSLHIVRGNEWIFHFQGSGLWYTVRCHHHDCLEQGPGMLTRLRNHLKSNPGCRYQDLKWPYTDQLMIEHFGYQVTGGVFDRGSRMEISEWVNDSNDIIRHRKIKKSNK